MMAFTTAKPPGPKRTLAEIQSALPADDGSFDSWLRHLDRKHPKRKVIDDVPRGGFQHPTNGAWSCYCSCPLDKSGSQAKKHNLNCNWGKMLNLQSQRR